MGHSSNDKDKLFYLVDFGLAHEYRDKKGVHLKAPKHTMFKGTISYCSINLLRKHCKNFL